jgi:hypothetical protein
LVVRVLLRGHIGGDRTEQAIEGGVNGGPTHPIDLRADRGWRTRDVGDVWKGRVDRLLVPHRSVEIAVAAITAAGREQDE